MNFKCVDLLGSLHVLLTALEKCSQEQIIVYDLQSHNL